MVHLFIRCVVLKQNLNKYIAIIQFASFIPVVTVAFFHWTPSYFKPLQFSKTLFSILADLCGAVVWMVLIIISSISSKRKKRSRSDQDGNTHEQLNVLGILCIHLYGMMVIVIGNPIYPTPPHGQDMTQGQFFKRSLIGLNSEFSFSWTSCLAKAEEPSLPYYLSIAGGRIIGFIPFPRVLVLCEMQSVLSRNWTRIAVFISCDDNNYTIIVVGNGHRNKSWNPGRGWFHFI